MDFSVEKWMEKVRKKSTTKYKDVWVKTSCGKAHLLAAETNSKEKPDVLFIHGWRQNSVCWDLNNNIKHYTPHFNVYLVDLIGQPGLTERMPQDFVVQQYGVWLTEILDALKINKVNIVSVSYGSFVTLVFATVAAHRINKAVLLAPAGLSGFSTGLRVVYRSILTLLKPNQDHAEELLKDVILNVQWPHLKCFKLYVEYMAYAFGDFISGARPPFKLKADLVKKLDAPVLILLAENDMVFKHKTVIKSAKAELPNLQGIEVLPGLDHGLELSKTPVKTIIKFLKS